MFPNEWHCAWLKKHARATRAELSKDRKSLKSSAFWTHSAAASKVLEDLFSGFGSVFSFLFFSFFIFPEKHSKFNKHYFSYLMFEASTCVLSSCVYLHLIIKNIRAAECSECTVCRRWMRTYICMAICWKEMVKRQLSSCQRYENVLETTTVERLFKIIVII